MEPNDAIENILQYEQHNHEFSVMLDDVLSTITDRMYNPPSVSSTSSASSSPTFTNLSQPNIPNLDGVRLKIVEQPALKGLRFRYICEGRSAGSIPGVHSTPENKTFPTIEVEGYEGKVKVVVSCVTKDEPYRPHPHNLVGKEGCEYGVCLATINGPPMRAVFSNLGIQCVKKKDIKAALEERERKRIDPFKTSFAHKDQPSSIDLNVVRLCFQAFIPIPGVKKPYPIPPVVSDPIHDKKSINDLVICRLCSCAAKVTGGDTIILLCEKVPKDDIKIRFFELRNNEVYWEDFAQFQPTDVHKQAAITFKTPRYINPDVKHSVQVYIQLFRPSDGETSEALPFEFHPDQGMITFPRIQRKLKHKRDMEIFQQILSLDSETTATKYSVPSMVDADNDNEDTVTSDSSANNFKRKRIDPMNLLRNIQQLEQNQMQCNISNSTNMDTSSMWNIKPAQQSPTSNIPEVKAEPFLSPNYYGGSYRNSYQASPSPQPTSPMMNRNITTPSPGLMRNSSAESQTQMSNLYNQSQMNQEQYHNLNNNFNISTSIGGSSQTQPVAINNNNNNNEFNNAFFENNSNFNMISPQQQTQFSTSNNMFVNRTSGGSFTPIYDNTTNINSNQNNNNSNTQLPAMNITNNIQQVQAVFGTNNNMIFNQFQETNITADSSLFNLSQLDDLVPLQNSDELRISNLSIST